MKEDFLHYVWQHQYFDKKDLATADGESFQVLRTGILNTNAGPDFLGAQVKMNEVTWNGSVEIHLKSSDWYRHNHHKDPKYDQVILHMVWEHDQVVKRRDGTIIPVLEIKNRVPEALLQNYLNLTADKPTLPCAPFVSEVPHLTKLTMTDRVLLERLDEKACVIQELWQNNKADWEETAYQVILSNFGFKVNQEPFLRLSKALPYSVIRRHQHQRLQIEALLFGQAGFLEEPLSSDQYQQRLSQEFAFLRHKYSLQDSLTVSDWNFFRLRPANFPTVRLAQLASLLLGKSHLFATLVELENIKDYYNFFEGRVSDYWQEHYMFSRQNKTLKTGLGKASKDNLLINTVIPLIFAYGRYLDNQTYINKALSLLEQLKPEENHKTKQYKALNFQFLSAFDSQAYIQLYNQYCAPRKCLSCSIGHYILKNTRACQ